MKQFVLLTILSFVTSCATSTPGSTSSSALSSTVVAPEKEIYFAVEPTSKTRIITHHVQTENFSTLLESEFNQAMASLAGKCWLWAVPSYKEVVAANGPEYCLKFVSFKKLSLLKPYKPEPTDKKMLLTALSQDDSIQVQNFVWDGAKLKRVRNSDSKLGSGKNHQERFANFMVLWALK